MENGKQKQHQPLVVQKANSKHWTTATIKMTENGDNIEFNIVSFVIVRVLRVKNDWKNKNKNKNEIKKRGAKL